MTGQFAIWARGRDGRWSVIHYTADRARAERIARGTAQSDPRVTRCEVRRDGEVVYTTGPAEARDA